ncbi:recombinase family protein [Salmonella enterica]|nr:recombinase family protein [Salmonella enterica]EEG2312494.1 recombinase family protein [Salmonella enterica]EEN9231994.1 recombinase family protein [Salmonella enterica]EEQ1441300.1 recombinase family protein [Salmonella enterica]EFY7309453.1 recombinase family protein [Salmonella enterica]
MTLAFSYARFSTKSQAIGTSLERQLNASRLFCSERGLTLSPKGYHDLGVSGFKQVKRPELEQMLHAIQSGDIPSGSYILIEAIDRLSRKGISHTQDVLKQILQYKVKVAFVGEDAKTLNGQVLDEHSLNDLSSVILVALAADLAHKESVRKSKLVKAAKLIIRKKATEGHKVRGHTMFWIDWSDKKQDFVLNDRVKDVQTIIQLRREGQGPRKIAKTMNELGIKGPRGNLWNHMSVTIVLKSPVLYGAYQTHQIIEGQKIPDVLLENHYPALLTKEEYIKIQADSSKANKGRPSKANPFSGVLRCECGQAMLFSKRTNLDKNGDPLEYEYHFCIGSTEGRCKNKKRIRDLVPLLASIMDKLVINQTPKKNLNTELIKATEQKIEKLNNMLVELDNPPMSVLKTIQKLEQELDILLNTHVEEPIQADVKTLSSISDAQEYNQHLKRLVKQIVVYQINGPKNLRIKVHKTDGHYQNFLVKDNKILFKSDTKALKELIDEFNKAR